jgi:hypothetical protein
VRKNLDGKAKVAKRSFAGELPFFATTRIKAKSKAKSDLELEAGTVLFRSSGKEFHL